MKKHLIYICILWIVSISCSNDDNLPNIRPSATGEYTDARDGNTYQWVRLGKQEWMASNLKYGTLYYENEYDGPLADGTETLAKSLPTDWALISKWISMNMETSTPGKKR